MLVLSRKVNETICIGESVRITVIAVHGSKVRLGIDAPIDVEIRRGELPPRSSFAADDSIASRDVACVSR